jgi:hypothetical protein
MKITYFMGHAPCGRTCRIRDIEVGEEIVVSSTYLGDIYWNLRYDDRGVLCFYRKIPSGKEKFKEYKRYLAMDSVLRDPEFLTAKGEVL